MDNMESDIIEIPNIEDIVNVKLKSVDNWGTTVELIDYGYISGFILPSELDYSNKIGEIVKAKVVRTDTIRNFIDLEIVE